MNHLEYNTLILNGNELTGNAIADFCFESDREDLNQLGAFIKDWLDESPKIEVQTSGSTGTPAIIEINKSQMLQSAGMTAEFFQFKKGETALLCLPTTYIAGKMMVVRALYSHLNLFCIPPSANPLTEIPEDQQVDFAPLIPLQLDRVPEKIHIKNILLGGSPVSPQLERRLSGMPFSIFHGYGMTETLSHVALRRVNGEGSSKIYQALKGIHFETDDRDCLVIHAPFLKETVVTNDAVELLTPESFTWKGRIDFVINSGGVKLFPEIIESKISSFIGLPFFIAGLPDERFGEKVSLFIEGDQWDQPMMDSLDRYFVQQLERFEHPKEIIFLNSFEHTTSGKIKRPATIAKYLNGI